MVKPLVRERHYRRSLFRKSVGIDLHGSADRGSVPESDLPRLRRLFNWRDALVVVRPETMVRWHPGGWKLFSRLKSRPGRPPIPRALQTLIRRIANENPSWGQERIAKELVLKLGMHVSPRTVRKYLPRRPPGRPRGDLRWSTFLRLHAQGIVACDFRVLKSPPRSPKANAVCGRVIGTIRRECLDWLIPLSESHLRSILKSWIPH